VPQVGDGEGTKPARQDDGGGALTACDPAEWIPGSRVRRKALQPEPKKKRIRPPSFKGAKESPGAGQGAVPCRAGRGAARFGEGAGCAAGGGPRRRRGRPGPAQIGGKTVMPPYTAQGLASSTRDSCALDGREAAPVRAELPRSAFHVMDGLDTYIAIIPSRFDSRAMQQVPPDRYRLGIIVR